MKNSKQGFTLTEMLICIFLLVVVCWVVKGCFCGGESSGVSDSGKKDTETHKPEPIGLVLYGC